MEKESFKFAKIHPFSNGQAKVIKTLFSGYTSNNEIARYLKISPRTVRNHLSGSDTTAGATDEEATKTELGIFGIVERITGKRPSRTELISTFIGDVVFSAEYNMYERPAPPFLSLEDSDSKRGIDIIFQDFRPNTELPEFSSISQALQDVVDCLEIDFIDQKEHPNPFRSVFFNIDDLRDSFEHARLAVEVSRLDDQPLDPTSGRLLRYEHDEAVSLGIVPGFEVINMAMVNETGSNIVH